MNLAIKHGDVLFLLHKTVNHYYTEESYYFLLKENKNVDVNRYFRTFNKF